MPAELRDSVPAAGPTGEWPRNELVSSRPELAGVVCSPDRCFVAAGAQLLEGWISGGWEVGSWPHRARLQKAPAGNWQAAREAVLPHASYGRRIPKLEIIGNRPASAESVAWNHRVAGLRTSGCRSKYRTLVIDHSWKAQPECGALSWLAGKVDCTIVQLNHPECCGEADAGASLFGGEVKLKHAALDLPRDSRTGVAHRELALARRRLRFGWSAFRPPSWLPGRC